MYKTRLRVPPDIRDSAFAAAARRMAPAFSCPSELSGCWNLSLHYTSTVHSQEHTYHVTMHIHIYTYIYTYVYVYIHTHTHTHTHTYIYIYITVSSLYNLTDSETRLRTLKWKTDKSKTKFCFVESFSPPCELFTGRIHGSPFSNALPLVLISLAVPTERRQAYALRYHKSTHECLKLNTRTWRALLSHGANTREVSYLELLTEHLTGRAGRTNLQTK
jgi:hypothetical protein